MAASVGRKPVVMATGVGTSLGWVGNRGAWVGLPHSKEPGPPLRGCPAGPPARSVLAVCVQPELHGALVDGPRAEGQEGASSRDSP